VVLDSSHAVLPHLKDQKETANAPGKVRRYKIAIVARESMDCPTEVDEDQQPNEPFASYKILCLPVLADL
jgi:hypothetical protein